MREAAALKFQLLLQVVPAFSLFRGGFRRFCCRLALCHNSYSVVLSAATQRFGRRNWVLFAILPAIKMLSPFPHTRIMHADSNSTLFHKSEFAHKLPQSIFSVKSFFAAERDKFTQQTHKNEYLHSNYTYFTINSFQKHQYVLLCDTNTSDFLHFPQTAFFTIQRNKLNAISIQQTQIACSFVSSLFTLPAAPRFPDCPARHGKAGTARSRLRLLLRPALCQIPAAYQHSASPR